MKDIFSSVSIQGCKNLVIKTHGMYVCCILIDSDTQEFCGKMQCVKSSVITHVGFLPIFLQQYTTVPQTPLLTSQVLKEETEQWPEVQQEMSMALKVQYS